MSSTLKIKQTANWIIQYEMKANLVQLPQKGRKGMARKVLAVTNSSKSLRLKADVSSAFKLFLGGPIYVFHSVDNTKLRLK